MSFVSERVAQALHLRRFSQNINVCGITGLSIEDSNHSLTSFKIASVYTPYQQLNVSVVVVPRVTCNLPIHPVPLDHEWEHVKGLRLADPEFGKPGKIDLLLGVETFVDIVRHGLLRKWNSSEPSVLQHIDPDLQDAQCTLSILNPESYTKTLGIEWNSSTDQFRLTVAAIPQMNGMTKRALVSDIAKIFDMLGWYSPMIVKAKILLQLLWSQKIGWDDPVPDTILQEWLRWRNELHLLSNHIPRCYYPKEVVITSMQIHGFSDASERAYSGVVYLRIEDSNGNTHTSMVMAKTRVAPIKRQTIPRLELCGPLVMARILSQCKEVLKNPIDHTYAWTDSTIVLSWLQGNPRRFKVFVGNRVAQIMELISPERWRHVIGEDNPADCASRGIYPSEVLSHDLWWNGPEWLRLDPKQQPNQSEVKSVSPLEEANELCSAT